MNDFIRGFFANRAFGFLVLGTVPVVIWLTWSACKELLSQRTQRRQREQKLTRYNSGQGIFVEPSDTPTA